MNRVHKITPSSPFQDMRLKPQHSPDEPGQLPDASAPSRKDHADLSSEWKAKNKVQEMLDQLLSSFQKNYPGVGIFLTDGLDRCTLPDAAAALGEGTHFLLSREFLEQMKSSQEAYQKGKSVLIRLLGQLSSASGHNQAQGVYVGRNEALFWSAPKPPEGEDNSAGLIPGSAQTPAHESASPPSPIKQLWQEQESARKGYDEMRKNGTKVSLQIISRSYAGLSAARTKGQVQSVIAKAQRNITALRFSSSFGEVDERMKARAAIASMQKLLQRGGRKIRRLNEEELVSLRQRRAHRLQEQQKALQLRIERERLQTQRRSADNAIQKEGELEELNQSMRFLRRSKYHPYDTASSGASIPELPAAPAVSPTMDGTAIAAPLAAADISITSVPLEF